MNLADSAIAPYITLLVIFAVLAGFFRKALVKVILTVVILIVLLAIFPQLALQLLSAVAYVRGLIS
jgi:hypothetical protein